MKFDSEPNYEGYAHALDTGCPRQLARLRFNGVPGDDAYEQLREAFIFHWRYALRTLRWHLRCALRLRCPMCLRRHVRTLREEYPNGGGLTCSYGWLDSFSMFRIAWFAGKHGED